MTITALDLFAGTGWGVACQRLGIEEYGVEIMPEAVATRTANGMNTLYHDVWDGLLDDVFGLQCDALLGSPPCQTFSMQGSGAGRAALNEVLQAIELEVYKHPEKLLAFGQAHDLRTALVLAPLAHIWRDRPQYVALEQVPTVLPVWQEYAKVMRKWGYSVQVEVLSAEEYGVPQTRKRAILVARVAGPVNLPQRTHASYRRGQAQSLPTDVARWVTIADTLGHDAVAPYRYLKASQMTKAAVRSINEPAFTITAGNSTGERGFIPDAVGDCRVDGRVLTVAEAAALQTYPVGFEFTGSRFKQYLQIGNAVPPLLAQRILGALLA